MKSRLVLLLSSLLPLMTALPAAAHDACAMPESDNSAACAPAQESACACHGMKEHHAMGDKCAMGMHGMKSMAGSACGADHMQAMRPMGGCPCGAQAPCGGACGAMGGHGNLLGHRGHMAWMRRHPIHFSHELRYAPATTTLTFAWAISRPMNDWFSVGLQDNNAWQVMPSMGQGHWFSDYMGLLPQLHKEAGPFGLNLGALVGAGAMLRTFDAPGVGNDLLQLRAMWAIEPRVELSWRKGGHSIGLVGTYLWTPNMADLGGYSVGLETTFAGPHWGK